jgi:class 3 adenylate cyclase
MFDDMRDSTALKAQLARQSDEEAYHALRREHDDLVRETVTRDAAGRVLKSTGDGLIVIFSRPSVAVERAIEIQERLHEHPHLRVRIGIDMGEVKLRWEDDRPTDVFGLHVDLAARAVELTADGHICVTRTVYTDAFSWVTKKKIAWKEHGPYRLKPRDPALDAFEPYNANVTKPLRRLRGDKVVAGARRRAQPAAKVTAAAPSDDVAVIRPWEMVARDGRDFAGQGAGAMYWFRVPLGGISYPEGFRSFLQPALENEGITKIRFVLDGTLDPIRRVWDGLVLPLLSDWGAERGDTFEVEGSGDRGRVRLSPDTGKVLSWVFVDLSREFSPCFKLLVSDLERDDVTESEAQVFLSTAARTVWLQDGSQEIIRVPDSVLRIRRGSNEALLHALNAVANQWDSLFT